VTRDLRVLLPRRLRGIVLGDPSVMPAGPVAPEVQRASAPPPEDPRAEQERQAVKLVLERLTDAASALQRQQREGLDELRRAAVELAVAVASRLVKDCVEAGNFAVEARVRQVLERLDVSQPVTIFLHPEDLVLLEKRLGENRGLLAEGLDLRLAADASLHRGDCRAEAPSCTVLARMEAQLADIRRHLLHVVNEAGPERRRPEPALRPFPERRQTA
jgi:flagellar biosynthesis/type III secretory pathway protein FliH